MNIQIAIRHETADGRIRKFVEAELERINQKYSPISADVVLDHEGHNGILKTAEFNVKIPGEMLHVKESSDDLNKSIELGIRTIEKQLHKFKELHSRASNQKRQIGEGESPEVDAVEEILSDEV